MLRLNIRCLNNQARFDPRRLPRGDERKKDREREDEGERERKVCSNVRASEREGHKGTRAVSKTRKRERGRGGEGDSGSYRVGIEHVLYRSSFSIRARSSSLPPLLLVCSPPRPPLTLRQTSRRSLRRVFSLAVLTLSVYTYYAKQVTVGGLGSQTHSV